MPLESSRNPIAYLDIQKIFSEVGYPKQSIQRREKRDSRKRVYNQEPRSSLDTTKVAGYPSGAFQVWCSPPHVPLCEKVPSYL